MRIDRSFRGCFWLIGVVLVLGCTARSAGGDTTVGAGDASGTDVLDAADDGAVGDATEAAVLRILQNQIPLAGCLIPGNTTDVYRPMGLLDVQVNMGYMLFPLLRYDPPSQLARSLALQSFAVSVDLGDLADPDVPGGLVDFSVAVSGALAAGQTRSSTVTVISGHLVEAVSAAVTGQPVVTVDVTAVGQAGEETVSSAVFRYPIQLCDGCLVQMLSPCPGPDDLDKVAGNPCGLPQDGPVSCCNHPVRGLICLPSSE